ncbi:DUF4329 domain-containing protein [Asticcacaulis sp. W401b]|uniref:DUF4329 domain-containing protein n=1 Tax=Asticcacaulis sp. W401b TaxID=3388666 RepID=UPI003970BB7D
MRVLSSEDFRWVAGGHVDSLTGYEDNCGYDEYGNPIDDDDHDSWWENALEAVGDFLGLDGSFGYDGEDGREWIWEDWGENIENAIDNLVDAFDDWWGDSAQATWDDFTRFLAGDQPVVPTTDLDVTQYGLGSGVHFSSAREAIMHAFYGVSEDGSIGNREVGGYVREATDLNGNKYYFITEMGVGGPSNVNVGGADGMMTGNVVATFHTHGQDSGDIGDHYFSPNDIRNANANGDPTWMMGPDGSVYSYDPSQHSGFNPADDAEIADIAAVTTSEGHIEDFGIDGGWPN